MVLLGSFIDGFPSVSQWVGLPWVLVWMFVLALQVDVLGTHLATHSATGTSRSQDFRPQELAREMRRQRALEDIKQRGDSAGWMEKRITPGWGNNHIMFGTKGLKYKGFPGTL